MRSYVRVLKSKLVGRGCLPCAPSEKVEDGAFYNEAINSEVFSHRPALIEDYARWRQDHHQSVSSGM